MGEVLYAAERALPLPFRPWRPFRQCEPYNPVTGQASALEPEETFHANAHYLVHRAVITGPRGRVRAVHLSMRTVENDARHDWREMQRVKNELCGPEWEAIELYPAESRVVDTANQYHLWCFPPGGIEHNTFATIGWTAGRHVYNNEPDEERDAWLRAQGHDPEVVAAGATQRPLGGLDV